MVFLLFISPFYYCKGVADFDASTVKDCDRILRQSEEWVEYQRALQELNPNNDDENDAELIVGEQTIVLHLTGLIMG